MPHKYRTKYLKQQRRRKLKNKMIFFLILVCFGGLAYLLLFSDIFQIKKIEVLGANRVPEILVYNKAKDIVESESFLSINNNLLFANINLKQIMTLADIDKINISKNYFSRTLRIRVFEKEPIAKIVIEKQGIGLLLLETKASEKVWYLSEDGKVFQSDLLAKTILPKIYFINFPEKTQVVWDDFKILSFKNLMNHLKEEIRFEERSLDFSYSFNRPSAITYHFDEKFDIFLTLNKDIVEAYKTAHTFANKEVENKTAIFKYIDARYYPEKLYYK